MGSDRTTADFVIAESYQGLNADALQIIGSSRGPEIPQISILSGSGHVGSCPRPRASLLNASMETRDEWTN